MDCYERDMTSCFSSGIATHFYWLISVYVQPYSGLYHVYAAIELGL